MAMTVIYNLARQANVTSFFLLIFELSCKTFDQGNKGKTRIIHFL